MAYDGGLESGESFSHLVRAALAIALAISLPFVLAFGHADQTPLLQTYEDALAAIVAFYFGASAEP